MYLGGVRGLFWNTYDLCGGRDSFKWLHTLQYRHNYWFLYHGIMFLKSNSLIQVSVSHCTDQLQFRCELRTILLGFLGNIVILSRGFVSKPVDTCCKQRSGIVFVVCLKPPAILRQNRDHVELRSQLVYTCKLKLQCKRKKNNCSGNLDKIWNQKPEFKDSKRSCVLVTQWRIVTYTEFCWPRAKFTLKPQKEQV